MKPRGGNPAGHASPRRLEHVEAPAGKGRRSAWLRQLDRLLDFDAGTERPLYFALSLCAGCVFYFTATREPSWPLVLVLPGLAGVLWLAARRLWRLPLVGLMAFCIMGVALGGALAKGRVAMVAAPQITSTTGPLMVEGWISSMEQRGSGARFLIEVHAVAGLGEEQTPRRVRVTQRASTELTPGRFVRCWSVLNPPPAPGIPGDYDFQREAWFQQLGAVGYVQGRCRAGVLGAPETLAGQLGARLGAVRARLADHVAEAAGERAGGFAAALVSGDRSRIAEADRDALRDAGLAHLLAISGLHMAIVGGLVYLMARRALALIEPLALRMPIQKPAALIALAASFAYLLLSGASVSTQRAFLMAAIFFGAILFDRAALSLRSFALAMMVVIAIYPASVLSPGFQMSFAATGMLIAVYEAWSRRRRGRATSRWGRASFAVNSLIVTSIVGSLATAPFAIYQFGRMAPLGLLGNLLAMPIVSFVSAPAAGLSLILAPFGLSDWGLRLFGLSLEWVLAVSHWCAGLTDPDRYLARTMPPAALVLATAALAVFILARGLGRWLASAACAAACGLVWFTTSPALLHWAPSGDVYLLNARLGYDRIAFVDGDGLGPLRFSRLETAHDCSRAPCRFQTPQGAVILHPPDSQIDCRRAERGPLHLVAGPLTDGESCPRHVAWPEVERAGGQSVWLRGDGLRRARAPACTPRPWAPCRPGTGAAQS